MKNPIAVCDNNLDCEPKIANHRLLAAATKWGLVVFVARHEHQKSATPNRVYEAVAWAWRFFLCNRRRMMTKPRANKANTNAYSSGSGMTWLLTMIRTEPLDCAAKRGFPLLPLPRLFKVPAKKSPIGLFKMLAPTQAEDCPLE